MIKNWVEKLLGKQVGILLKGTTIAQLLPIMMVPFFSRIFDPMEFGLFYLFGAFSRILYVFSTGKYELSIVIPKDNSSAYPLLNASLGFNLITAFLTAIVLFLFSTPILDLLNAPELGGLIWLLPFSIVSISLFENFNNWAIRTEAFSESSNARIIASVMNAFSKLSLGLFKFGAPALILGNIIGLGTAGLYLSNSTQITREPLKKPAFKEVKKAVKSYIRFPKNVLPGALLHAGSLQIPLLMLTPIVGSASVGLYGLMQSLIRVPVAAFGTAFGDAFRQQASAEYTKNGHCKSAFSGTLKKLIKISILPFALLMLLSPFVFSWILGDAWAKIGLYTTWFAPSFFLYFLIGPLTPLFYIVEKSGRFLWVQIIQFISIVGGIFLGNYLYENADHILLFFAFTSFLGYLITLLVLIRTHRGK